MTPPAREPAVIRWSTTTEVLFHVGVLGQAGYLSDAAKEIMSIWVLIALLILPFLLFLFFRHGEQTPETVARAHLLGALWYLTLSLIAGGLAAAGYRPHGWLLFIALMTPGAILSLLLVKRRLGDTPAPDRSTS